MVIKIIYSSRTYLVKPLIEPFSLHSLPDSDSIVYAPVNDETFVIKWVRRLFSYHWIMIISTQSLVTVIMGNALILPYIASWFFRGNTYKSANVRFSVPRDFIYRISFWSLLQIARGQMLTKRQLTAGKHPFSNTFIIMWLLSDSSW